MSRNKNVNRPRELEVMREGYRIAMLYGFPAVNSCPFGGATVTSNMFGRFWQGNEKTNPDAHSWYRGFWFYLYVTDRWNRVAEGRKDYGEE